MRQDTARKKNTSHREQPASGHNTKIRETHQPFVQVIIVCQRRDIRGQTVYLEPKSADQNEVNYEEMATISISVLVSRPTDSRILVIKDKENGWRMPGGDELPDLLPSFAAEKHCLNEANVAVEVDGVFRVEYHATKSGSVSQKFIFSAHPVGMGFEDAETVVPTTKGPDEHSECACWMLAQDLLDLLEEGTTTGGQDLSGCVKHVNLGELVAWADHLNAGGTSTALTMLDESWSGPDHTFTPMPTPFSEFSGRESVLCIGSVILICAAAIGGALVGKYFL
jgi:hypothetical protein